MFPYLFSQATDAGPVTFKTYGLMLMIAFLAAGVVSYLRAPKVGIDGDHLGPLMLVIIAAAILGSRLLHFVMAEPAAFFANPLIFFSCSSGGMAVYGGIIGATLASALYARARSIPFWKLADVAAPTIALGQAIGRMGCFAAGCCHGSACPLPVTGSITGGLFPGGQVVTVDGFPHVALLFERGVGVGAIFDTPTYPTQVWETLATFTLFLFLSWMWARWRRFDGQVFAAYLFLYAGVRYTIELYRGDTIRGVDWFGLFSTSQLVAIGMVSIAAVIAFIGWRRGLAPEAPITRAGGGDSGDEDLLAYD